MEPDMLLYRDHVKESKALYRTTTQSRSELKTGRSSWPTVYSSAPRVVRGNLEVRKR
jgi:hypothetical protein